MAFYKNRHKNRNGNEKAIHLRVERPCMSRRVSACLRPKTKRGEKLLLWDDQGIPIGHPGLALSEQEPGKPADPDNVIIRAGLQENNPYLEVGPEPDNNWEDKLEPKPIRQNVKKDRGNVLNTCRELGQTRDKGSRWRGSPWIPWWRPTQTEAQYLSCYAKVPKKEGGIFDILIRFTLKKAWTF